VRINDVCRMQNKENLSFFLRSAFIIHHSSFIILQ
jgi:hypothetical protein